MLKSEQNKETVDKLCSSNHEFKKLYDEHVRMEQDLEALYSLKYIPAEVESKIKEIKVAKLRGKDRMLQLMADTK